MVDLPTLFFSDRYRKQIISFFRPNDVFLFCIEDVPVHCDFSIPQFDQTTQSYIDVWFTILDKPPIKGDVLGVKPQLNLTQAYAYLKKEVKLGLAIGINYPQKPMVSRILDFPL